MEIDYLMNIDRGGIIVYDGPEAKRNNITEWLNTPQGTVWGNPLYGNQLGFFKHEPSNPTTSFLLRESILDGLDRDIPDNGVEQIEVIPDPNSIDLMRVKLGFYWGFIDETIRI